ncbi:MAG: ceramidase domain-containing protein [Burkholderiales bacterium]
MSNKTWQKWILGAVTVGAILMVFRLLPIPQDSNYHNFSDGRTLFGLANLWNVISNAPFVFVGGFGLSRLSHLSPTAPRVAYIVFCIGVMLVGLGSGYYHYSPSSQALVWDRLPMTIAFMAFFSMVVQDRVSQRLGSGLLWPLIVGGAASIRYWHWSELQGEGDLRAYVLIQFLPMLLIPLMLMLFSGKALNTAMLWATIGTYASSKVAEHFDGQILDALGFISGHSIKHLLGALAVFWTVIAFRRPAAGIRG